ncbi:hypothetical protein [Myxococcus sp. CA039A]|uniref:hypothetical protein n=1 Tax=Myxococcus sp. CA039A TaxID=2741737 RepID=UPI00157B78FD|nr:hypothetical protein [Myxococcus sp. CA039A]NTX54828.1 hypothetical protein [Myxococcus sp. CA039A]
MSRTPKTAAEAARKRHQRAQSRDADVTPVPAPKSMLPRAGALHWLRLPDGTVRVTAVVDGRVLEPVESDSLATALADAVVAVAKGGGK